MAYCPHCNVRYDETNETQPCCYKCGHPISCGCRGGHSHTPSPPGPPDWRDLSTGETGSEDSGTEGSTNDGDDSSDSETGESFSPDDDLPF
jgi:hypothetical protein